MGQEKKPGSTKDLLGELTIPPCPTVLLALTEEIRKTNASYRRLSSLVSRDVGLSGAMINAANSSYFALRTPVSTVQQAMAVLGLNTLTEIVTGLSLRSTFNRVNGISMERFWERANYLAKTSSLLAVELSDVDKEDAYNFGLFHEAGIPVLMQKFASYKDTLQIANATVDRPFTAVEDERHGTNHAAVGYKLAETWALSDLIRKAILCHHDYEVLRSGEDEDVADLVAIGVLAEHVANVFLRRTTDAEAKAAQPATLEYFGLDSSGLRDLTDNICDTLRELREGR